MGVFVNYLIDYLQKSVIEKRCGAQIVVASVTFLYVTVNIYFFIYINSKIVSEFEKLWP